MKKNGFTVISGVSAPEVANAFCKALREELTPDQMRQVLERNEAEQSDAICHSHDFCDANVVMDDVCTALGVVVAYPADEPDEKLIQTQCDLWNEAWGLAKAAQFDADKVDAVVADIAQNGR